MSNQKGTKTSKASKMQHDEFTATGVFECSIQGEPILIDRSYIFYDLGNRTMNVWGVGPLEGKLSKVVTVAMSLDTKPGTYNLGHEPPYAYLLYTNEDWPGPDIPAETLRGTLTVVELNPEYLQVTASFEFHAWAFGQMLQCVGSFELSLERPS